MKDGITQIVPIDLSDSVGFPGDVCLDCFFSLHIEGFYTTVMLQTELDISLLAVWDREKIVLL